MLTAHDAVGTHVADELGLRSGDLAKPVQAGVSSAGAFTAGAAIPLAAVALLPAGARILGTIGVVLVALVALGAAGAAFGKASRTRPMARVVIGGSVAMGITMLVGAVFGAAVG